MIIFEMKGDHHRTKNFLKRMKKLDFNSLAKYGDQGVRLLKKATPKRSGLTAASWYYTVTRDNQGVGLEFRNSNLANGWAPVAILIQYGHMTGTGGFVKGVDYINPALQPLFDSIAKNMWKEVTKKDGT